MRLSTAGGVGFPEQRTPAGRIGLSLSEVLAHWYRQPKTRLSEGQQPGIHTWRVAHLRLCPEPQDRLMVDITKFDTEAHLQATLNVIPAYAWYAAPSGSLTFVKERTADYLVLPIDHPLRFRS